MYENSITIFFCRFIQFRIAKYTKAKIQFSSNNFFLKKEKRKEKKAEEISIVFAVCARAWKMRKSGETDAEDERNTDCQIETRESSKLN